MSLQFLKYPFLKSLSLSAGLALLLANSSAMAAPWTGIVLSQANPSDRSVVVDTEGDPGTSNRRTPGDNSSSPIYDSGTRFSCQVLNGEYTVAYQPESRPSEFFPWAKPAQMGGGWSPQKRCAEIARRLESYRPDGLLELTTGVENGYNTVCVTTEQVPGCRIVFTVPSGQDPIVTRDRVFENLSVADSGQQTDGVYTYRNRENGIEDLVNMGRDILGGGRNSSAKSESINLRPFLDKKDGGTGTQLQDGVPIKRGNSAKPSNSNQLNPGNFR